MIEELRIADLGVINDARIEFDRGLTVVTGETGAGKTMIVSGIGLLLGGRADPRTVRTGADRARVEATALVPAGPLADRVAPVVTGAGGVIEDDSLLMARHVTAAGRSRAYLGGAQVPAAVAGEAASELVTVHGQSEQIRLGSPERQREILDRFCGEPLAVVHARYREAWTARRDAARRLDELQTSARQRAQEIDLLRFGLDEVAAVEPQPGEDRELAAEADRLQAADDLRGAAGTALAALAGTDDDAESGSALGAVAAARRATDELAGRDPSAAELATRTAELGYLLGDLTADLSRYLDGLETEPGRLEQIAARRSALQQLTRKYGADCDEVLGWAEQAVRRLTALETSDHTIDELSAEVTRLDAALDADAAELTRLRTEAADALAERVRAELVDLAMPHARVVFEVGPAEPGPHGRDTVDLLFTANPGTEPRSLARAASGGELSRVRLAVEVVLADGGGHGSTFVFDEVDAGVGGKVATEIGRRLARLAEHAQVIVVTHLAQVAAFADRHYVVAKADDGQVTTSGVREVRGADRSAELARMMAGLDTTESALAHADELLELARTRDR
ncbi:DNA repair protein RecN (Recombination protein N) [Friedmanniella endophytica]|uniref:DNA repair protein RecN n=1 Tax=Microlunatus kandeliicorticis TaxID=1759536 RepID=A0A7W3IU42_9ACTN|nr:DNA repair protein RecN [Microlunatus kandeliicorticis]MBA8795274.1 DNA repair protein RecN (Recombination protein N) [Microlunatus kandeliicorticis]